MSWSAEARSSSPSARRPGIRDPPLVESAERTSEPKEASGATTDLITVLVASIVAVLAVPLAASAAPIPAASTFTYSKNMHPLGFSPRANTISPFTANSDLAFRGRLAFQGNYDGFRIVDISEPDNPVELLDYRDCAGNQGDVIVLGDVLVRSWNSPAPAGATCDGEPVPPGVFPGMGRPARLRHQRPERSRPGGVGGDRVRFPHRHRRARPRQQPAAGLQQPSSAACPGIDIVQIPLDDPASASYLRFEPAGRSCHDTGVILGDALKAACAGGNGFTTWSLDPADGGSLENPAQLYSTVVPGVTIGHSAGFTWDGKVLIFGHEPGGGAAPNCQATSSTTDRSCSSTTPPPALRSARSSTHDRRPPPRTAPGTTTTSCPPTSGMCW